MRAIVNGCMSLRLARKFDRSSHAAPGGAGWDSRRIHQLRAGSDVQERSGSSQIQGVQGLYITNCS